MDGVVKHECELMKPGQPCARWETPPSGVCSRHGGDRVCGDCINDADGPALGFRRNRDDQGNNAEGPA